MWPIRARSGWCAAAAVLVLAVGCGQQDDRTAPGKDTAPNPSVETVALDSLRCGPEAGQGGVQEGSGTLPDGRWVRFAWCPMEIPGSAPSGTPSASGVPDTVEAELGTLADALRKADEPRTKGVCTLEMVLLPTFWLVDEHGQAFQPRIPVNSCGKPQAPVVAEVYKLIS